MCRPISASFVYTMYMFVLVSGSVLTCPFVLSMSATAFHLPPCVQNFFLGCLSSVRKRLCVCLCTCVCVWNHGGGTIQPSGHLNSVYCPLVVCLHGYVIMAGIKNSLTTPTLPHARSNAHNFTCISIFQQNINRTLSLTHTHLVVFAVSMPEGTTRTSAQ